MYEFQERGDLLSRNLHLSDFAFPFLFEPISTLSFVDKRAFSRPGGQTDGGASVNARPANLEFGTGKGRAEEKSAPFRWHTLYSLNFHIAVYLSIWHYFFGFLRIHLDSKAPGIQVPTSTLARSYPTFPKNRVQAKTILEKCWKERY